MKTFPMFLQMAGRRVVIFGGGEQAAQKTRLMLKTEAEIVVIAAALEPELADLAAAGRVTHRTTVKSADFDNTILAFAASGCAGADAANAAVAKTHGITVNVVDMPALCDAITPSIVDRDPVVVAIGTEGTAPVLGRQIKTRIEEVLEPRLGDLAAFAGRMRGAVAARVPQSARRGFWRWVFADTPRKHHAAGRERDAIAAIKDAIAAGGAPGKVAATGSVALVGAGPGAADLMTLRGVKRLQEADVILYDRLSGTDVLELARRDAERICVGKTPGDRALPDRWSQDRINRLVVQKAAEGHSVVRLKCGDPGIFARGAEEVAACEAAGIPVEIVPGITAACAAAAEAGRMLTERDRVDSLVVATATRSDGVSSGGLSHLLRPGSLVALYMGVGAAPRIAEEMLETAPPDLPVDIVQSAGHAAARQLSCTLGSLAQTVADEAVQSPAMILIGYPSDHHAHQQDAATA